MDLFTNLMGSFLGDHLFYAVLGTVFAVLTIGYTGAPVIVWTLVLGMAAIGFGLPEPLLIAGLVVAVIANIKPLRAAMVSAPVLKMMKGLGFLPQISPTERTALDAGVVWVEKDLFSGKPDFKKLMSEPYPDLTPEEKAFLDGPVEELCQKLDEWKIWNERQIPTEVWEFLGKHKFFGMIIPKAFGGLEFSALAHSHVIMKLASRSVPTTITTMVPNSLGPAELLTHYGTQEQKDYYLPRLADGREIPCFALTEPKAGSDASSLESSGVVFKGDDGKLYVRLNWNKRWITLAAVSTVLGMAFRLFDPENLLGKGEDVGITCALIPADSKGVVLGQRHDPLGVPFYNCPTQGNDVVISVDQIIGGIDQAGGGWEMLMESLAAGRGISLPAQSTGCSKLALRNVTAHASIRKQFGLPIGKFEGVEEPLARIGGYVYTLEAFRRYTLGALDKGIKPPVVTAICKYHSTELGRVLVNDCMDILGGAGISRGPRNMIANYYFSSPISVTVEGANILTRTLIIFGQGALRAHPFAYEEIKAAEGNDIKAFDRAFWGHVGHVVRNLFRAVLLSMTRGRLASSVRGHGVGRYYQKLAWASASFAITADLTMAALGGALKQREKITGRFADILSWMYIGTSILRRYEAEGYRKEDLPLVHYSMRHAMAQIQNAFDGIYINLKVPGLSWFFNGVVGSWSRFNAINADVLDSLTHDVADIILQDTEQRDRLTDGIHISQDPEDGMGRLEAAFKVVKQAEGVERKIKKAVRAKQLPRKRIPALLDEALEKNVISSEEHAILKRAEEVRWSAIQVDDFSQDEYLGPDAKPTAPTLDGSRGSGGGGRAAG